jgi:hypothetical protein
VTTSQFVGRLFARPRGWSRQRWRRRVVRALSGAATSVRRGHPLAAASFDHLALLRLHHDEPYRDSAPSEADGVPFNWRAVLASREVAPMIHEGADKLTRRETRVEEVA